MAKKVLWSEDECTKGLEGHEYLDDAWQRLFGEKLDKSKCLRMNDFGDCMEYVMPNGHSAWIVYDCDEITVSDEEK